MIIKKLIEFTNYDDNIVDKLPTQLTDDSDIEPALNLTITPDLIDIFQHIVRLAAEGENEEVDDVLTDLDDLDRKELVDALGELYEYISRRVEYVTRFN